MFIISMKFCFYVFSLVFWSILLRKSIEVCVFVFVLFVIIVNGGVVCFLVESMLSVGVLLVVLNLGKYSFSIFVWCLVRFCVLLLGMYLRVVMVLSMCFCVIGCIVFGECSMWEMVVIEIFVWLVMLYMVVVLFMVMFFWSGW